MNTKKLFTKYTPKELAEAFVFPVTLTKAQQKEAREQLAAARKKRRAKLTNENRLNLNILQLKIHIEDYIEKGVFNPDMTFGHFLKRYVDLLGIKRKQFAEDITIDESLLSQFINQHRTPPDYIAVRLEIHSNNAIPATYWVKLVEKQREHELSTDQRLRMKEKRYVRRRAAVPY